MDIGLLAGFTHWLVSALAEIAGTGSMGLALVPFVPLYTRLKRERLLDHTQRKQIYDTINGRPGVNFSELMGDLAMKNGVLAYHLMTLEREEFIVSRRDGVYRRYYPRDAPDIPDEIRQEIMDALYTSPGISQSNLARYLKRSRQVINYHIRHLSADGFVKLVKIGRRSQCYVQNWVA